MRENASQSAPSRRGGDWTPLVIVVALSVIPVVMAVGSHDSSTASTEWEEAAADVEYLRAVADSIAQQTGIEEFRVASGQGATADVAETMRPGPRHARFARVSRVLYEDMLAYYDDLQIRHDVVDEPGEEWLDSHYLAHPSDYPEVPAYFNRTLEYLDELVQEGYREMRRLAVLRLSESGLSSRDQREFLEGFTESLGVTIGRSSSTTRAFVNVSLELHEFLLANESAIALGHDGLAYASSLDVEDALVDLLGRVENDAHVAMQFQLEMHDKFLAGLRDHF